VTDVARWTIVLANGQEITTKELSFKDARALVRSTTGPFVQVTDEQETTHFLNPIHMVAVRSKMQDPREPGVSGAD
jgi:hypothetical protein